MDLLKLLEPYNEDLDYAFKGMGITKKVSDNMPELIDIWVEVQKKHTEEIYGNPNHAVDRCNNCSNSVLKNLYRWREIYKKRGMGVSNEDFTRLISKDHIEFKGVPQEAIKLAEGHYISNVESSGDAYVESMKWPQFKTYCKEQGLSVKGKKRAELMKELGL